MTRRNPKSVFKIHQRQNRKDTNQNGKARYRKPNKGNQGTTPNSSNCEESKRHSFNTYLQRANEAKPNNIPRSQISSITTNTVANRSRIRDNVWSPQNGTLQQSLILRESGKFTLVPTLSLSLQFASHFRKRSVKTEDWVREILSTMKGNYDNQLLRNLRRTSPHNLAQRKVWTSNCRRNLNGWWGYLMGWDYSVWRMSRHSWRIQDCKRYWEWRHFFWMDHWWSKTVFQILESLRSRGESRKTLSHWVFWLHPTSEKEVWKLEDWVREILSSKERKIQNGFNKIRNSNSTNHSKYSALHFRTGHLWSDCISHHQSSCGLHSRKFQTWIQELLPHRE